MHASVFLRRRKVTLRLLSRLSTLLNELRRRKVVRVLAAYVVTAAAVIGVASDALPALNADAWVLTAIVVAALSGVPLVVFLAWAYDVVPDPGAPATATDPAVSKAVGAADAGAGGVAGSANPLGRPRHALPTPATPFIGRDIERRELAALLTDADCRLITVTGPGGVGKTRLALEAARESEPAFRHGIVYVPLSSVPSADLLVSALADAAGITVTRRDDPVADVLDFVREKQLLMVLDNFEHLMDGSNLLVELIDAAPGLSLLVTSRERLRLTAETILPLAGLPVSSNGGGRSESAALFLNAARRLDRHFGTDPDSVQQVQRICELLSGLPLAIELAAAWVRVLSCGEIVAELESGLDLLSERMPSLPEPNRSLRATFDSSWRLLSDEERDVARQLAVFRSAFDRAAALDVAGTNVTVLSMLVDKSLLTRSGGRFMMVEVVRQYAHERLAQEPDALRAALNRHLDFFARLLEGTADAVTRSDPAALAAVGECIDEIRAAWTHAVVSRDADRIRAMQDALFHFYDARGWAREGLTAFDRAVAALDGLDSVDAAAQPVAAVLGRLNVRRGVFHNRLGEIPEAGRLLRDGLAAARASQDSGEVAFALQKLAANLIAAGDYDAARGALDEARRLAEASGDGHALGWSLAQMGTLAWTHGDYDEAARLNARALDMLREDGDRHGIWVALNNLGVLAASRKRYDEARIRFLEGLALQHELGNRRSVATLLHNLGAAAVAMDDIEQAGSYLEEALAISEQMGYQSLVAISLVVLADLALRDDEPAVADAMLRRALRTAIAARNQPVCLEALLMLARLKQQTGDLQAAARLAAVIRDHTAGGQDTRDNAAALLAQVAPAATPAAAEVNADLDTLVASLLVQDVRAGHERDVPASSP
ncbi:hypothetical protein BH23GEM10_BH23GEM10_03000 [soil metagenome]